MHLSFFPKASLLRFYTKPRLFKGWIALSTGYIITQGFGTCEVRRMNRSRSFAVLFDKLSRIERQSRPKYKSAVPELIHTSNLTCAEPNN